MLTGGQSYKPGNQYNEFLLCMSTLLLNKLQPSFQSLYYEPAPPPLVSPPPKYLNSCHGQMLRGPH